MKKTTNLLLAVALAVAVLLLPTGCERKVTVLTGEIVICTAGEILEDNTEEVEVPASDVADYGVTTRVITCERHGDLASLYAAAQKAIADGDLVTARERLRTIVETDPSYANASDQLAKIDAGERPEVDSGDTASGDTGDSTDTTDTASGDEPDDTPVGPVVSLTKYVPDTIEGYVAQGILADMASLSRQYIPLADSADQLVIEVEQQASAERAVEQQLAIIEQYPDGSGSQEINGKTVMVGVRGEFAAAVFIDGPITVIVELHSTGDSGEGLIRAVYDVVESISG